LAKEGGPVSRNNVSRLHPEKGRPKSFPTPLKMEEVN